VSKFLVGLVLGLVAVPLVVYAYLSSGNAPVATSAPPMPFERMMAQKALHAIIDKEMPKNVPVQADEPTFTAGAQVYRENCAVCHGLPGQPKTAIAKGMFPDPPVLLEGKGVTDDPAGESYWKVAHGIRLSGMPGFKDSLSDTQMWQVSVLLAEADKLPASVKTILAAPVVTVPPANTTMPPKQ
jgi:thiosulfate dehydrogenase